MFYTIPKTKFHLPHKFQQAFSIIHFILQIKTNYFSFNAFNQRTVKSLLDMKVYTSSHKNNHAKQTLLSQSSMESTHNTSSQNLDGFLKGEASLLVLPVLSNLQYS